jgi:hypothetical protein
MSQTKEDIIRRVKGLMAKTTDAGCTEAEAMAASALAAKIMAQHDLALTDIKLREQANCQEADIPVHYKTAPPTFMCANAIAYLTDTKAWCHKDERGFPHCVFFGFETDTIVAKYLYAIIDRAMLNAWMKYEKEVDYKSHSAKGRAALRTGFDGGMATRINQRLRELKDAQQEENIATTGRDLMVVKSAVVADELAKLGITFTSAKRSKAPASNAGAWAAGESAGDAVSFNKGVGANAARSVGRG